MDQIPDTVPCGGCNGDGWVIEVEPRCCGRLLRGGECCGEPDPEQVQVQCPCCDGSGRVPVPSSVTISK